MDHLFKVLKDNMEKHSMNSYERVMAALRLEEPDRIPSFEWSINERVSSALEPGCGPFDFEERIGLDAVVVYADERKNWLSESSYIDEWGVTMAKTEEDYPTAIDFPLKNEEDLERYKAPDPEADWHFESLKEAVRRFKGKKAILMRLRDAGSIPRNLRGMENIMMDYVLNPDLVRSLVRVSVDYHSKLAYRAMELGADLFWSSDDYCDNRGPIMGPEIFREFILPGLTELVFNIRKEGFFFIKHNDGNINPILQDLVNAGITCIDPIDAEAGMSLSDVKHRFGTKIAIKGGVPVTKALAFGTIDDVIRETKRCIREGGHGGGYILSSSSDIIASVKPANYRAMLDTLMRFGTYPLDEERLRD